MNIKSNPAKENSIIALFLRLYWMILGYIPAFLTIANILKKDTLFIKTITLFFIFILLLIFVRFIDIKFYDGTTADGKIATMRTFFCFSAKLLSGSIIISIILYFLPKTL